MSGFCGVASPCSEEISEPIVAGMLRAISHRGPDGEQRCADGAAGVALGHAQLNSFVREREMAPAGFADLPGLGVALDGCIFGRRAAPAPDTAGAADLPRGLHGDLRTALVAYQDAGAGFLAGLDGPFSLALFDKRERRLLLSRDKLGEKSLYYHYDASRRRLVFASEIKAILAHPGVARELDRENLSIYLCFGYIPGAGTLFRGIRKLLPGESLCFRLEGEPETSRYWRLPRIEDGGDDEAAFVRELRELFLRGLEDTVHGCRDVAVFLSGGMDSSIIVAALRELGVSGIHTFTLGFAADATNPQLQADLHYARLVARAFATDHHEVVIGPGHALERELPRVVRQYDDLVMTPNTYTKYLLAKAVRAAGLDSVLTGSAAAGACGIHRRFLDPKKRARLLRKTEACRSDEERFFELRSRLFDLGLQRRLLTHEPPIGKREILDVLASYVADVESDDFFRLFLFLNLRIGSTEKALKDLDRSGSLASVEVRAPYLDRALIERSTKLPASYDGGRSYVSLKTQLGKAFEADLPRPVLERKVIGYPSYYWTNGELDRLKARLLSREVVEADGLFDYQAVQEVLEAERHSDAKSRGKHSWALVQLALWHRIHLRRDPEFTEPADADDRRR